MPSRNAQTQWIQEFKGQWDKASPGATPAISTETKNIKVQFGGHIQPRGGINIDFGYGPVAATSDLPIIGLWSYPSTLSDPLLVRMTPATLETFSTSSMTWGSATGTAVVLLGTAETVPQATIIDDIMVFVNEGANLPFKLDVSASADIATIGSGATPPYAKSIESYLGFLMLGCVSDDGTFLDVVDGKRTIVYSDDWDNDWSGCAGNTIILDETPGDLIRMVVLGKDLICFKSDGIVKVKWVGGSVRFTQEQYPFPIGISGALTAQKITDSAILFLGTDGVIYKLTADSIQPVSEDALENTLPFVVPLNKLHWARAVVSFEDTYYYLFFTKANYEAPYNEVFVGYEWKGTTFVKGELGVPTVAVTNHKWEPQLRERLMIATADGYVGRFDDRQEQRDQGDGPDYSTVTGTRVDKYFTTNWIGQGEEGWCYGARLIFAKETEVDYEISGGPIEVKI